MTAISGKNLKETLVFVSSPSDVEPERNVVDSVIEELNRAIAREKGLVLRSLRYERDTVPAGMPSQEAIDHQTPPYHVYIGILWKRFGTPTGKAESGTESEFRDALKSFRTRGSPWIMFYFCEREHYSDKEEDLEQFRKVLRFRKDVKGEIHPASFKETEDFERAVRSHLTQLIIEYLGQPAAHTPGSGTRRPSPAKQGNGRQKIWNTGVLATTELTPVGRAEEIQRVAEAIANKTSLVITGIGGIGKSTVLDAAIRSLKEPPYTHLAFHRITEEGSAEDRLRHLLSRFISFLHTEVESSDLQDLFSQARELLKDKSVLFAIDNADDEESREVVHQVRDQLPALTLAVTSTERAWNGIVPIELRGMDTSESVRLFREICGQKEDDEDTIKQLCERVQGHPMMIVQVAVEARDTGVSAEKMLRRFKNFRLGQDLTTRFQAARARLPDAAQRALAVIGQLSKTTVRLDLVKEVADAQDSDLQSLTNQFLVRISRLSPHLSVHRLVHSWSRENAGEERQRYLVGIAEFYHDFLNKRRDLDAVALEEIDEEWENILGLLDTDTDPVLLARLVDQSIEDHFDEPEGYVLRRRQTIPLMNRSEKLEAYAREAGGKLAARLEKNLGHIFYLHGKTQKARSLFLRAHERYLRADDQVGVTATTWLLGYLADDENRYQEALDLYREGTQRAEASKYPSGDLLAVGHHLIGSTLYHQGDLQGAERQFRIARSHVTPDSRPSVRSRVERRLGSVLVQAGRTDEARDLLASALRLAHAHEHNRDIARTARQVGRLHFANGELLKAERQYKRSHNRFQQLRSRRECGGVLRDLGELRRIQGRLAEARGHVEESVAIARQYSSLFGEAAGNEVLAQIARDEKGSQSKVNRHLHRARNIYTVIGHANARRLSRTLQDAGVLQPALPPKLRGVMFDLMDTLAYLPPDTYERCKRLLAGLLNVKPNDFVVAWNNSRKKASAGVLKTTRERIEKVAESLGVSIGPAALEEAVRAEDSMWAQNVHLYPDAKALLESLAERGLRLAIIANGPIAMSVLKDRLGLARYLHEDAFFLSSEICEMKPDPAPYRQALSRLELQPEECVFVGDGDDQELDCGAMELGIYAIRVTFPGARPGYVDITKASRDWNYEVDSLALLSSVLTGPSESLPRA